MTAIIGIDFSGARADRNSWVAQGELKADGAIEIWGAYPAIRQDVASLLKQVSTPAVAAIDFPFGVPSAFIESLIRDRDPTEISEVWKLIRSLGQEEFIARRDSFIEETGHEPKREGDNKYFPESFSPLHKFNPNMLPMTYEGIWLLHRWHCEHPCRWHVPPLEPTGPEPDRVTLLELMPGAFLKSVGLPYKGYKKGRAALERRDEILSRLAEASAVDLPNLDRVRMACRANDDCLDAVVAAVGAAAWAKDASRFHHPGEDELADAKLEGWIYVPRTGRLHGSA